MSSKDVVTCSVTDLVGQYCGHTGPKVINQFDRGLGKVLFIDEAYRLNPRCSGGSGSAAFMYEAIGEIVDAMTKPRYVGNMVVILACYTSDMEDLLDANQGLRSRFPAQVTFPNMEPHHCLSHLAQQLHKLNIVIAAIGPGSKGDRREVLRIFERLGDTKGWANGRDVETLAKRIISHVFVKAGQTGTAQTRAEAKPEVRTMEEMLQVRMSELPPFLRAILKERGEDED